MANAVDVKEELAGNICSIVICIFETAKAVGEYDFLDLNGEALADGGEGKGFFFGRDSTSLFLEGGEGFPIGEMAPVVVGAVVVVCHLL